VMTRSALLCLLQQVGGEAMKVFITGATGFIGRHSED
jgi:hypothetical protein